VSDLPEFGWKVYASISLILIALAGVVLAVALLAPAAR
jgi:hypothetical protein